MRPALPHGKEYAAFDEGEIMGRDSGSDGALATMFTTVIGRMTIFSNLNQAPTCQGRGGGICLALYAGDLHG